MLDETRKHLDFLGSSYEDLLAFPAPVRREAGYQLDLVQQGKEPEDWKPMTIVGPGTCEIRLHDPSGAYRVMYVAKLDEAVYVLHCFRKKTQATEKHDIDLAKSRYKILIKERK